MVMNSAMTKEDRDRYHWFQNAQNLFWQSPIWEVQTRFDEQFNETLLDEIYGIGKDIVLGKDKDPKKQYMGLQPSQSRYTKTRNYRHCNQEDCAKYSTT